jgi:hypothetical protein
VLSRVEGVEYVRDRFAEERLGPDLCVMNSTDPERCEIAEDVGGGPDRGPASEWQRRSGHRVPLSCRRILRDAHPMCIVTPSLDR